MTAWINGILGIGATFWIAAQVLGWDAGQILQALGVNFISGLVSPLLILQLEGTPWIRRHILTRSLATWAVFCSLYFGLDLLFIPGLREFRSFAWLVFPLILATGISIIVFGPIQDRIVRRKQRRAKSLS